MWQGGWVLTTNKDEHLPEGWDQERVRESFVEALQKTADAWYEANRDLVACEPLVH
jgi:hypothetical protein